MADLVAATPVDPPSQPFTPEVRHLLVMTAVLVGQTVLHDLDHLRQGRALPTVLYLVAVAALTSLTATIAVLLRYPGWARPTAMAQGVATLVGVGAVHVAPRWSPFTDSYTSAGADIASWAIIIAMMVTGCALAVSAAALRPAPALRNG